MTESGGGEDAVVVVQPVDVHHAQVQQLQHRGQRSGLPPSRFRRCVHRRSYLCDLDVGVRAELRDEEVLLVPLGFDLSVQLQPRDGRLRTQVPLQRLRVACVCTRSVISQRILKRSRCWLTRPHLQHEELRLLDVPRVTGAVRHVGKLEDFGWVNFLLSIKTLSSAPVCGSPGTRSDISAAP